jgi:hypothetical protein
MIISSAFDAWVHRDTLASGFDAFWRKTIAEAADASPQSIEVRVPRRIVEPDSRFDVDVLVRSAMLGQSVAETISVALEREAGDVSRTRAWPTATPGVYRATLRAPSDIGVYRLAAAAQASSARSSLAVVRSVAYAAGAMPGGIELFTAARGGRVVSRDSLPQLSAIMRESVTGKTHAERWFPMRSAWWIIPFSLALGAEWWWRRRRGRA